VVVGLGRRRYVRYVGYGLHVGGGFWGPRCDRVHFFGFVYLVGCKYNVDMHRKRSD
jgi:hypothetical protein